MSNVTQLRIDTQILTINKVVCRHIDSLATSTRGVVSQDILSQLRNFVEHIMLKFYANDQDIENNYDNICKAIDFVKTRGNLKVLRRFHDYLQVVASHYTLDEENSERLMLKYYEYLLRIKNLLHDSFSLNILSNLDKFPLNMDSNMQEYYEKIATKIKSYNLQGMRNSEKYYIQKIKPFFVSQRIYYEITFTPANDYASKFNRVIAFTSLEITENYAVKFTLARDSIEILGKTMPIIVIVGWEVAIRDCEFRNFTSLIRGAAVKTGYAEQQGISLFLTSTGFNLTELVDFPDAEFQEIKQQATQRAKTVVFFNDLELCRTIMKENAVGSNLLRYLLYHMNNKVIKNQQQSLPNNNLSGLYVKNGCIPFDSMPFNTSPIGHNPRLGDLFACIDTAERQHEILARLVRNNTEIKGQLFTPVKDIVGFDDIASLVKIYNSNLWQGHLENSKLVIEAGHIFINGYKNDTRFIINQLEDLAKSGVQNYSNSVKAWLREPNHGVDCDEKKEALTQMFESSRVALMYGSAGTGKSTLINHLAHFFADKKKLFLAQTNPAVDNLKRRVTASNCTFSTITKFLKRKSIITDYDVLIIDECSTVNNRDMRDILIKATYKLLVMVGDSYQIASIRFGNWFNVARMFVPETSVYELKKPYRSNNQGLLSLWDRVRKMDDTILELITRQGYSNTLDVSLFAPAEANEIILCLNYDGLYGINNINRFLQESNTSAPVSWGIQQYKVNDPILFNESDRFAPLIYNNMKGRIVGIEILDIEKPTEHIQFDIELEMVINGVDAFGQDFELLDNLECGHSVIRFCVNKLKSTDEDDDSSSKSVVPFQVAYAVSIHKAQGLEYNSVKIVITDEIDELITHNIFYTAITRARNKLKIYWTPEVEQKVLSSIKPKNNNKDIQLLKLGN
ncbi:ATP-dependent RecD-like DNA helicase [Bacillus amyloliquefaciens]|uniref:ATP-dependent DNA helicase n=1 Tax=Bacillus amyloliquefaciens TaxID=1390 RepID=UPI0022381D50|nr:ATP-dependent RecD-like DNA helicase [Bacillus amyloliquefaciens]MCW5195908.1 RecBCD enzyme subunit RecD [Bacillus amyloliquefaciens]